MTRPLIIDTFPVHNELDILEMRLTELYDAVDWFVAVEADVTHQDRPKPFYITENLDRFDPWVDKLVVVRATGLPTLGEDDDPWARELAQRGHVADGLAQIGVSDDDVILHGDVDEIPRASQARNLRLHAGWIVTFEHRLYCFAVDWRHPDPWYGTVAARVSTVAGLADTPNAFARLREERNRWTQLNRNRWAPLRSRWIQLRSGVRPQRLLNAGWHFSWLGGQKAAFRKVRSFAHPEVADRIAHGLETDFFLREGWHVDGQRMTPVDVDDTWPKWIVEGNAPASWYRPR